MIPEPPKITRGPQWLQDWLNALRDFVVAIRPLPSDTIEISESPQGTRLDALVGGAPGESLAVAEHPFLVVTRPKPGSTSGELEAGVILESSLYKSLRPNDKFAITGLLNEARTTGWFDLLANDAIWLGITFAPNGDPDYAGIDSWGQGNEFDLTAAAWDATKKAVVNDNGSDPRYHQTSRKLIAYTIAGDSGEPVLTPVMMHDQVLLESDISGRSAKYPFPHEGGYPF